MFKRVCMKTRALRVLKKFPKLIAIQIVTIIISAFDINTEFGKGKTVFSCRPINLEEKQPPQATVNETEFAYLF